MTRGNVLSCIIHPTCIGIHEIMYFLPFRKENNLYGEDCLLQNYIKEIVTYSVENIYFGAFSIFKSCFHFHVYNQVQMAMKKQKKRIANKPN